MKKMILVSLLSGLSAFAAIGQEASAEKPLWEFGMFGGAARLPHYRGSDEYSVYALPLPYLIYRGEFFRANREGLKGVFWSNDRIETAISLSGTPPSDEDNTARRGMPDLGAILEIGPGVKVFLSEQDSQNPLYLKAGVRAAVAADTDNLNLSYEGIHGDAKLIYRNRSWLQDQNVALGFSAGVDFANRGYNDYIYSVDPVYAMPSRPAYWADGGYGGFSVSANAVKKINDSWSFGAYYRWDNMSGAASVDSPLVKTENNHIIGVALIWKIAQSDKSSFYDSESVQQY